MQPPTFTPDFTEFMQWLGSMPANYQSLVMSHARTAKLPPSLAEARSSSEGRPVVPEPSKSTKKKANRVVDCKAVAKGPLAATSQAAAAGPVEATSQAVATGPSAATRSKVRESRSGTRALGSISSPHTEAMDTSNLERDGSRAGAKRSRSVEVDASQVSECDDGFTTVINKRSKNKAVTAPAAKQQQTQSTSQSLPSSTPSASEPASKRPPPIQLTDKVKWSLASKWMSDNSIHPLKSVNLKDSIKIQLSSIKEFRDVTRHFESTGIQFFTHALPEEKRVKVIVRGLHKELPLGEAKQDLIDQGVAVIDLHRLVRRTGSESELVLAIVEPGPAGKKIFGVRSICQLSNIRFEPPRRNSMLGQCHRCQLYGHASRFCRNDARCVKCLVPHLTQDCPRTRESPGLPACVLCGKEGHPANYRGCPAAPKLQSVAKRRVGHSQDVRRTSAGATYPALQARRPALQASFQAPQAPLTAHQAPRLDPRPAPQQQRTYAQLLAPQAPQQRPVARPMQPTQHIPSQFTDPLADMQLVMSMIQNIDIREISILASKLRAARDIASTVQALLEHQQLVARLQGQSP